MKNSETRAYAAALVDGEGTIRVNRVYGGKSRVARYVPYTRVTNTDHALLLFLKRNFNGNINEVKSLKQHKRAYIWQIWRGACKEFLREIEPYLITKKAQARLVLACPAGKAGRLATPSEYQKMEDIHKKITILNRRGRRAEQLRMELKTQEQLSLL